MIVIIVGAGIAGLACSIALAQHRNIEVTIFERATELVEVCDSTTQVTMILR